MPHTSLPSQGAERLRGYRAAFAGRYGPFGSADFAQTVPGFREFLAVRDRFDPNRRFVNPHLQRVLGD